MCVSKTPEFRGIKPIEFDGVTQIAICETAECKMCNGTDIFKQRSVGDNTK